MKKNQIIIGKVEKIKYPNYGIIQHEDREVLVKGSLPQQEVEVRISKVRRTKVEAKLQKVITKAPYEAPSFCEHFGECGGCARQTIPYSQQLKIKKDAVEALFKEANLDIHILESIPSPHMYEYRNKMEYSFGDLEKGGILNLGMHRKERFYDVVSIPHCHLVDEDFRAIVSAVEALCRNNNWPKYNRNTKEGLLRNLVVRKGQATGEILIGIATSSQPLDEALFVKTLKALNLKGNIVGIYHLINDEVADVVKAHPEDKLLYGRDYFYEELNGLKFKVSFFSFFQTNSKGAEILYHKALEMLPHVSDKVVYDLFSGTGTIGQFVSSKAKKVYGIEIIEDAVKAANENTENNNIKNCTFLTGDVFNVLDQVKEKPDIIIVDPPRAGMMPKTVQKIASYNVSEILYISCNPKTMVENLVTFKNLGYSVKQCLLVDMYPHTSHVETVVKLQRQNP